MPSTTPLTFYRHTLFESVQFRLRPAAAEDQPVMFAWRSDPEIARYLAGAPPESLAAQSAWFQRVRDDPRRSYHIIEDRTAGNEPLGFTSLVRLDENERCAEVGVVMGHRRGHGLVRLIAPMICRCTLELAGMERLYACINPGNAAAMRKILTIGAVVIDGPHRYRKPGETLFEIGADRFARVIRERLATETDLAEALQVVPTAASAPQVPE